MEPENAAPQIYAKSTKRELSDLDLDDSVEDEFDDREVFGEPQRRLTLFSTDSQSVRRFDTEHQRPRASAKPRGAQRRTHWYVTTPYGFELLSFMYVLKTKSMWTIQEITSKWSLHQPFLIAAWLL